MKRLIFVRVVLAALFVAGTCLGADNIPPDTSGNSMLTGKYWVRQVVLELGDGSTGRPYGQALGAASLTGAITFDGNGRYTFAGVSLPDSKTAQAKPLTASGTYRVGANGVASIDSVLFPNASYGTESVFGAVGGDGVFVGASTEGLHEDLFIAVPAGARVATNASLQNTFVVGHLEYVEGIISNSKNSLFQFTPNGQGGFAATTVVGRARGSAVRNSDTVLTQTVTGATYSFAADGSASITFPAPAGVSTPSALFTGTKTLYLSADGNYVLGGDPNGFDIFFGMRPLAASANPVASFNGVYYWAAVDADASDPNAPYLSGQYGSMNAFGNRTIFWHQRTSNFDVLPYDFTYDSTLSAIAPDGTFNSNYYKTIVGAAGNTVLEVGNRSDYSLLVAVNAPKVATSGVFLSPFGVLNAASFSPVTAPLAPGELITLFGTNLAGSTVTASALPFPSTLGGVQVMINGRAAPVYAVSPTQISAIVPYATSGARAKVQVINANTASNAVTMYLSDCAPGIFAVPSVGNGYGAVLHANFQLVSPANPAKQGEVVLIYLTGLGGVTPGVTDGAAGPASPLSKTNESWIVSFGQSYVATQYSGLAPGLAGLYQINVQIPSNTPVGDADIYLAGGACEAAQVKIPVVAGP